MVFKRGVGSDDFADLGFGRRTIVPSSFSRALSRPGIYAVRAQRTKLLLTLFVDNPK